MNQSRGGSAKRADSAAEEEEEEEEEEEVVVSLADGVVLAIEIAAEWIVASSVFRAPPS